jgi:hypothetical protein
MKGLTLLCALILFSLSSLAQTSKPSDLQSVSAGDIDSCKYLLVGDFDSDPYGIAQELRAQARARGFIVVSARNEIPEADLFKTCVMKGSWSATGFGGNLSVRVVDAMSGALIAEAVAGATAWWTVSRRGPSSPSPRRRSKKRNLGIG